MLTTERPSRDGSGDMWFQAVPTAGQYSAAVDTLCPTVVNTGEEP
jgi:hypothetical protein